MKKVCLFAVFLILSSSFALADLSDFPSNFFSGDKFNGYIVVGKEGDALDVLGQTMLAMKINTYKNAQQKGITKLDSDVDIDNNLILIGNPCVNKLTAELLDNPSPCDKDFPAGNAYIKYYEKEGNKYIVAAGYSTKGDKKSAEYLADYDKNVFNGDEVILFVEGEETQQKSSSGMPPSGVIAPPPATISENKMNEVKEESKNEAGDSDSDGETGQESKPEIIIVEDKGFFQGIFDWFRGLFRR